MGRPGSSNTKGIRADLEGFVAKTGLQRPKIDMGTKFEAYSLVKDRVFVWT